MVKETKTKKIICPRCRGNGYFKVKESVDHQKEDQEYPLNNIRITIMKYLKKKKQILKTIISPATHLRNLALRS